MSETAAQVKTCADCGKDMGERADHICEGCGASLCAACVAGTHHNDDYQCARCRWSERER